MADRRERHRQILELLARNRIDSQEQLEDLLSAEGVATTQSTLSRDLRYLGVVKGPDGYRADPSGGWADVLARAAEEEGIGSDVDAGGNVVVVRASDSTRAVQVANRLDAARLAPVVAVVACGSSVLMVTRSPADARDVVRRLGARSRSRRAE